MAQDGITQEIDMTYCEHCEKLWFPTREDLEHHLNVHHNESIYVETRTDFGYLLWEDPA